VKRLLIPVILFYVLAYAAVDWGRQIWRELKR
jgi:hypothetical protein